MVSFVKFWLRWHCAPPIEASGAATGVSFQQLRKHPAVGAKIHILADAHQRPAYQPRLLKHEFYEIAITEFVSIHTDFLETWTAKVEHLGG